MKLLLLLTLVVIVDSHGKLWLPRVFYVKTKTPHYSDGGGGIFNKLASDKIIIPDGVKSKKNEADGETEFGSRENRDSIVLKQDQSFASILESEVKGSSATQVTNPDLLAVSGAESGPLFEKAIPLIQHRVPGILNEGSDIWPITSNIGSIFINNGISQRSTLESGPIIQGSTLESDPKSPIMESGITITGIGAQLNSPAETSIGLQGFQTEITGPDIASTNVDFPGRNAEYIPVTGYFGHYYSQYNHGNKQNHYYTPETKRTHVLNRFYGVLPQFYGP